MQWEEALRLVSECVMLFLSLDALACALYTNGTQNSSGTLKILPGIGRLRKCSRSNEFKILRFVRECVKKIWDDIPNFRYDFSLHIVLLKER